jgi:hypothetical protein
MDRIVLAEMRPHVGPGVRDVRTGPRQVRILEQTTFYAFQGS